MWSKFDRFHGDREATRYNFICTPMILFTDEPFRSMSADSKILYSLMLNRLHLSKRNHWEDEYGVFLYYSITQIAEDLNCSEKTARKYQKELIDNGLVVVQVQGQGKQSKIYPCDFAEPLFDQKEIKSEQESTSPSMLSYNSYSTNNDAGKGKNSDQNAIHHDTSEMDTFETDSPRDYTENVDRKNISCLDWKNFPVKDGKNFQPRMVKTSDLERKNFPTEKEYLEKDINIYNPSIHQETKNGSPGEPKEKSMDGSMDRQQMFEQEIKENLSIDAMKQRTDWSDLEMFLELYQLIIDSCRTSSPTIRIGGEVYPAEKVRQRFLELNSFHLEYVIDAMKHTKTKIRNIRSYLLTALYRSPQTITSYYQAEVNHDLYDPEQAKAKNPPGNNSPSYTNAELDQLERKLLGQ